jgi:threonine/homoserine/homoserine lactone efflux protein
MNTWLSLIVFATAACVTPGPNNTMLLSSGIRFGFRNSLPHVAGIIAGLCLLFLASGAGLGQLFQAMPAWRNTLEWIATAYILFLAYRLATASHFKLGTPQGESAWTFGRALLFQWVNPKVWIMAIGVFTTWCDTAPSPLLVLQITGIYCVVCLPCIALWVISGQAIRTWMENPRAFRGVHVGLAGVLLMGWFGV